MYKIVESETDKLWDLLLERGLATAEEMRLVTYINGYSVQSLNDIIYVRTGYSDYESLLENEG